jgi:hypothetical protein
MGGGPPVWAGLRVRLMAPARLVSGSFTVLAVNSYATNGNCAGVTGIFRGQAPPFRAGLARPARSALLADVRPEGLQRCTTS